MPFKTWKEWSETEVNFLRSNYKSMSAHEIALRLDRTEPSIALKRKNLGLRRGRVPYTQNETEIYRRMRELNRRGKITVKMK